MLYASISAISGSDADSFNNARQIKKTIRPMVYGKVNHLYSLPNTLELDAPNIPEAIGKHSGYT